MENKFKDTKKAEVKLKKVKKIIVLFTIILIASIGIFVAYKYGKKPNAYTLDDLKNNKNEVIELKVKDNNTSYKKIEKAPKEDFGI